MAGLTLRSVHKAYGEVPVIKGVDLDIEHGEFVVFVGPSGCGKSTLLRMIAGLEDITEGTIGIGDRVVNDVEPRDLVYAPSLDVDFDEMTLTNEGLYYRDIVVGTGAPIVPGDSLMGRYKLWLPNGTLVEQNQAVNGVKFELNTLIPGWRVGIPGMKEGGTRQLIVRPSLGYGASPQPGIPANSVLM